MTHSSSLAMRPHSIEARTRKQVKRYRFLSFVRKYEKQLLETGLGVQNCFQKSSS